MANFQFIVSDSKTRKAYKIEVDQDKAVGIVGKVIGKKFNGDILGLSGYELQITGGTDKDGFPMHPQVHGPGRKKIILSNPPCFHPKLKGQRRRKMVRGNTISRDIIQINCKILKTGTKPIESLIQKEKKEEKVEKPKEKKKPEVKEKKEKPKEEKKELKDGLEKGTKKGLKDGLPEKKEEEKPEEKKVDKPKDK